MQGIYIEDGAVQTSFLSMMHIRDGTASTIVEAVTKL